MSRRVRVGARANGDVGLFIGPPGADANTAPDAALILNVSSKVSQLILMGRAMQSVTVPLGLKHSPFVFLTSQFDWANVIGHTLGPGPFRPSPPFIASATPSTVAINNHGESMTLNLALPATYQVYSATFDSAAFAR
jgi:hypothetical protein